MGSGCAFSPLLLRPQCRGGLRGPTSPAFPAGTMAGRNSSMSWRSSVRSERCRSMAWTPRAGESTSNLTQVITTSRQAWAAPFCQPPRDPAGLGVFPHRPRLLATRAPPGQPPSLNVPTRGTWGQRSASRPGLFWPPWSTALWAGVIAPPWSARSRLPRKLRGVHSPGGAPRPHHGPGPARRGPPDPRVHDQQEEDLRYVHLFRIYALQGTSASLRSSTARSQSLQRWARPWEYGASFPGTSGSTPVSVVSLPWGPSGAQGSQGTER